MKTRILSVVIMILLVGITPLIAFGQSGQAAKVLQIRLASHDPIGHPTNLACERFIKDAEARSNGTLKFTHYPAGQLAHSMKAIEMVQRGGIEMANTGHTRATGIISEVDLCTPYFEDPDLWARRWWDTASGGGAFFKFVKPKFEQHGLHVLPGFLHGPELSTYSNKPINKISDYRGLRMRAANPQLGLAIETWGARAVSMSNADSYMALQRRVIDGVNTDISGFRSRKLYEVLGYAQLTWMGVGVFEMIINLKWWNSLTPDQRKAIEESCRSASIWSWDQGIKEFDENIEFLKGKGIKIFDFKKEAPEEWEKMRVLNLAAQEKVTRPLVGDAVWKEHVLMLNATKHGKKTWREVLETMKY